MPQPKMLSVMRDPSTRPPLYSDRPWEFHDSSVNDPKAAKATVTALARKHTIEAIQTLVFHMRNNRDAALSMAAAEMLLSRGWGKAPQVTGLIDASSLGNGTVPLSLEDKIAALSGAEKKLDEAATTDPAPAATTDPAAPATQLVPDDTPVPPPPPPADAHDILD